MFIAGSRRVEENTAAGINRARQQEIDERLRYYAAHPEEIGRRLAELDQEWDIERAIQANAASVALTGLGLAAFVDRRFMAIPFAVAGFLLQHAIQGWCPPVPILRRLGFRTANEIWRERAGLEALRDGTRPLLTNGAGASGYRGEELHEGVEA
jgi:hypothetical protein